MTRDGVHLFTLWGKSVAPWPPSENTISARVLWATPFLTTGNSGRKIGVILFLGCSRKKRKSDPRKILVTPLSLSVECAYASSVAYIGKYHSISSYPYYLIIRLFSFNGICTPQILPGACFALSELRTHFPLLEFRTQS